MTGTKAATAAVEQGWGEREGYWHYGQKLDLARAAGRWDPKADRVCASKYPLGV